MDSEREKEVHKLRTTEVIEIIAELSGCDASDDYAKGWDDALRELELRIENYPEIR